ncbi:MAG: hypothetical protein M3Y29_08555 [Chloroflexota bacterium]|jgi:uncharacterized membrane protein YoaK (UPF0700 family)|nr:hypothetical protein [Chloroflexota bacterium]
MPPGAYAIVGLFAVVSLVSGVVAAATIGPRRAWAAVLPSVAAFGALYLVGHRLVVSIGPEVSLFGFRIALLFDAAVALVTAVAAAGIQNLALRLLEPKQRRAGRDGLA